MLEVDIKTGDRSAFSLKPCVDKLSLVLLGIVYVSFIGSSDCCGQWESSIYVSVGVGNRLYVFVVGSSANCCGRRERLCRRKFSRLVRSARIVSVVGSSDYQLRPAGTVSVVECLDCCGRWQSSTSLSSEVQSASNDRPGVPVAAVYMPVSASSSVYCAPDWCVSLSVNL